jgi:RimJ/RimL family protein N-acetyltransferase
MHPTITELMAREHIAELHREADRLVLRDGRRVALRPLRRADRDSQAALFARLSPESRRRRFLTPKPRLSAADLDHLSDVGHPGHEARAAIDERDGTIVGISRYVVHSERPAVAEVAIEVADDFQNHGIGAALAERTLSDARANGMRTLTATALWENRAARALLRRFGFRAQRTGGELEMALDLTPAVAPAAYGPQQSRSSAVPLDPYRPTTLTNA